MWKVLNIDPIPGSNGVDYALDVPDGVVLRHVSAKCETMVFIPGVRVSLTSDALVRI